MTETTNPLIGASKRETIENVREAMRAIFAIADKRKWIIDWLEGSLIELEREGFADDSEAIKEFAEYFGKNIDSPGIRRIGMHRLLSPMAHAMKYVAADLSPVNDYNRPATQVLAECAA